MSHEAQLQSIVSWAIPRHVETWNSLQKDKPPCAWAGYVPANAKQSVINPASFGWDFLLMLGCDVAALLELKYIDHSSGTESEPAFNTGQLGFLQQLEQKMLVRICFNANQDMIHWLAPPDAKEAADLMSTISALAPSELDQDVDRNAKKTLLALVNALLACTNDDGGEFPDMIKPAVSKGSCFPMDWERIAREIIAMYALGSPPPNLLFAMAGQRSLSMIRGESAKLVLEFLVSNEYQQLKAPIMEIGKAYLECLKKSRTATKKVAQNFDAAMEQLVTLANAFTFSPNDVAWADAHNEALTEVQRLKTDTKKLLKLGASPTPLKTGQN